MSDGVLDDCRVGSDSESLHDPVLVEGYGARFELKDIGDFLHRFSFCQELKDFLLATGYTVVFLVPGAPPKEKVECVLGDARREVGFAAENAPDGKYQFLCIVLLENVA